MDIQYRTLNDIAKKFRLPIKNEDIEHTSKILEIFNSENLEKIDVDFDNLIILNWIGLYYKNIKNYGKMIEYYLIAINKGDSNAMFNLACYYNLINNYEEMKKYYLMAIEKENSNAMYYLGSYYEDNNDYEEMKKYYLFAIEKENSNAMTSLGSYYEDNENYEEMKKYYLMAIEKGNSDAMFKFGYYYEDIKDYAEMQKYYLMAIEKENSNAMFKLKNYYKDNVLKLFNLFSNLNNKSEIVIKKINELSKLSIIDNYIDKVNNSINNIKDCIICYENKQHIQFDCGHEICINCYCEVENCYYKCNS
jgi:tetratricopeptide (TPR) repeat protein